MTSATLRCCQCSLCRRYWKPGNCGYSCSWQLWWPPRRPPPPTVRVLKLVKRVRLSASSGSGDGAVSLSLSLSLSSVASARDWKLLLPCSDLEKDTPRNEEKDDEPLLCTAIGDGRGRGRGTGGRVGLLAVDTSSLRTSLPGERVISGGPAPSAASTLSESMSPSSAFSSRPDLIFSSSHMITSAILKRSLSTTTLALEVRSSIHLNWSVTLKARK